jgi:hypothetical protein
MPSSFPGKYPNLSGKYEPNLPADVEKFPTQRRVVRLPLSEESYEVISS